MRLVYLTANLLIGEPVSKVILPFEMANIYWRRLKGQALFEVAHLLETYTTAAAKKYWREVLIHLNNKKTGRGLH